MSFVVHTIAQFFTNPRKMHPTTAYRILRYIRGTVDEGLFYPLALVLSAYADLIW